MPIAMYLARHRNSLLHLNGNTLPATQARMTCLPYVTTLDFRAMSSYRRHAMAKTIARCLMPAVWEAIWRAVSPALVRTSHFEAADLEELEPFLKQLPGIVVVDHMGRPDVTKGVDHPDFTQFIDLMAKNENIWTKVTCPERLTANGAPYDDVVPFYQAIVDQFEDRVLWGTDWPHPNMKSHVPDDGALVDYIPRIARTHEQRHKLLVANPMRLYWAT